MAFKMTLDSLDGLPEDVAKEYVEKDGKYHIQVEGMKSVDDFNKINTSLNAARTEAQGLKQRLSLLGDRKVEDVLADLNRIPELEAAAADKIDENKLKELAENRAKTLIAPVEHERNQLKQALTEKEQRIEQFEAAERTRKIHRQIRLAGKEAGIRDEAIEDALLLSDRTFELLDDGNAVVKADTGFTQGLGPKDWFSDIQSKRPHWFKDSEGGGAGGNRGNNATFSKNPFSAEHWNLTEQGKIVTADRARAEQLAKAAGTTIGGGKPAPKN